jgi:predicted metal-dependent hydrolase
MSTIAARVPEIDWSVDFDRHWNGGNPPATHAFNALSFLFPEAEKYFVEVVREVAAAVELEADPTFAGQVKGFVAQESIHRQQHVHYNAVLRRQGYRNVAERMVSRLQEESRRYFSPLTKLAVVCAYEHYTAILGNYILCHPQVLEAAQPHMALIWGWHGAEETEHKAVCFDLYRAAGGGWLRRVGVFLLVTANFNVMFGRLYFSLLHHDGCLKPARLLATLCEALRFFFGRRGVGWHLVGHGLRYLSPRFHPWRQDNRGKLNAWLSANQARLRLVDHPR